MPLYKNQKLWLDIIEYVKKFDFNVWSVDQLLKNNITGQTYQIDIFFFIKTDENRNNWQLRIYRISFSIRVIE